MAPLHLILLLNNNQRNGSMISIFFMNRGKRNFLEIQKFIIELVSIKPVQTPIKLSFSLSSAMYCTYLC